MKPEGESRLEFSLDMRSGVPFYKQIIFQVEMAIADGRLEKGSQLPTVRSLAVDLSINPNTVARAYAEMEIRNVVVTQQGSGTFISDKKINLNAIEREQVLSQITKVYLTKAASFGFSLEEILININDLGSELKLKRRQHESLPEEV
ncbi:MAG: GntR family transcriptional regulator [Sphaerochaeta sp.]